MHHKGKGPRFEFSRFPGQKQQMLSSVRPTRPDPSVMMPIRRTDDEDKGAGAPPGVIQWQDPDERDEALSMAAATNVALIRAAATRKIAESRSKGTPSRKNETVDSSALNLLRQPASQGSLAQGERVKASNTDQAPVVRLPVGQALGTFPFRSMANGGISAVAPEQYRAPEPRQSASEVQGSKSEAERKQEEYLAMAKRIEQEILDEEEAEREAEEMNAAPMTTVPVKQSYRPSAMPGMERVNTQSEKRQPPVRRTSPGRITDRIETFDADADYMEPIDVIWKKKTVTLPNLVRCIKCHELMSLYMDLRHARDKKDKGLLLPAYQVSTIHPQVLALRLAQQAALIPPVADLVIPIAQDDAAGPLGFGFAPHHVALVPERQQEEAGTQNQRHKNVAQEMLPPNLIAPATNGIQTHSSPPRAPKRPRDRKRDAETKGLRNKVADASEKTPIKLVNAGNPEFARRQREAIEHCSRAEVYQHPVYKHVSQLFHLHVFDPTTTPAQLPQYKKNAMLDTQQLYRTWNFKANKVIRGSSKMG
ncbi:hypothetical protein CAEBREN_07557 [Caenorhabditis brenneri]|uniref:Uncharacterized protein n=1 Tax=Caenorhabditis brenneri TaxID=135651 RepID=G0NSU3_CAEBE|nr:hypothetical protein CAEBREN_07557 [Caenorhabditis brenneri]